MKPHWSEKFYIYILINARVECCSHTRTPSATSRHFSDIYRSSTWEKGSPYKCWPFRTFDAPLHISLHQIQRIVCVGLGMVPTTTILSYKTTTTTIIIMLRIRWRCATDRWCWLLSTYTRRSHTHWLNDCEVARSTRTHFRCAWSAFRPSIFFKLNYLIETYVKGLNGVHRTHATHSGKNQQLHTDTIKFSCLVNKMNLSAEVFEFDYTAS